MTPEYLEAARRYARAKARFACGGSKGRGKLDPVYVDVTQGRDFKGNWEKYSSCGDLLHWHAEEMGVDEPWINRDGHGRKWEFIGSKGNIGKLQAPHGPAIATPVGYLPEAGDYLMCWNTGNGDVHVRIAGNTKDGILETFDFGAGGMTNTEFPGASCGQIKLITNGGHLDGQSLRTKAIKRIQKVIPLPVILALSKNIPQLSGEDITSLEEMVP